MVRRRGRAPVLAEQIDGPAVRKDVQVGSNDAIPEAALHADRLVNGSRWAGPGRRRCATAHAHPTTLLGAPVD
ncbi:hypothetical protein, partial [Streptomyces rimosus]